MNTIFMTVRQSAGVAHCFTCHTVTGHTHEVGRTGDDRLVCNSVCVDCGRGSTAELR